MLLITATLFAVQIKTDFHANKIVMNIFGAQERPNTDKIRYEYGQVSDKAILLENSRKLRKSHSLDNNKLLITFETD